MTAETRKNWGTIFMGADREVNLAQLASVAPKGSGFWNRDQETIYLERVQRRAEEQVRTILAQAGLERAALLEEACSEMARMREEAEQQAAVLLAESQSLKAEAARLHEEAGRLRAGAEEAGYAAGVGRAQAELEHFRAVMGESVCAVLSAVHAQCDRIFGVWKEDLCALLLACVEKGTGLVLDEDRTLLLNQLFLDSVTLFDAHSSVLVRVQPDDAAAVADMFAAAKERMPGLGAWSVQGDPDLAPGDLVLEAAHSRVESRIEERRSAVDAALRHLLLPDTPEEEHGRANLARANTEAVAHMLTLVPKRPLVLAAPHDATAAEGADTPYSEGEEAVASADYALYEPEHAGLDSADEMRENPQTAEEADEVVAAVPELSVMSDNIVVPEGTPVPKVDLSRVWGRPEAVPDVLDAADATDAVDAVLAEGGFLPAAGEA